MKKIHLVLLCLSTAAISCSKDNNNDNPQPVNVCAVAVPTIQGTSDVANPCAIAVSPSGMIAVSAYNGGYGVEAAIKVYMSLTDFQNGTVVSTLLATAPEAMAFDNDNNLYVSETEAVAGIKVFDHLGGGAFSVKKTIQDDFNNPRGLAFDGQNRLYLADDGTGRIIRFDNPFNSDSHSTIGNWDAGIKGLAIRDNIMYVTNYVSGAVSRNILKADGTPDMLTNAIHFNKATDVSIRGNKIIVTSYDSGKLGVYSDCDFSDTNGTVYDNFEPTFGTAFTSDNTAIIATYNVDKVTVLQMQ